jgi:hypothetical protein
MRDVVRVSVRKGRVVQVKLYHIGRDAAVGQEGRAALRPPPHCKEGASAGQQGRVVLHALPQHGEGADAGHKGRALQCTLTDALFNNGTVFLLEDADLDGLTDALDAQDGGTHGRTYSGGRRGDGYGLGESRSQLLCGRTGTGIGASTSGAAC